MDREGDFVVAWANNSLVSARRYSAAGIPRGGEFFAGSGSPSIAMDAGGNFVVTSTFSLQSPGSPPSYFVAVRGFNAAGVPQRWQSNLLGVARERPVPAVAMDADGEFVVVWQAAGEGGIVAQRFAKLPPRVTQVFVGGTAWAPQFRDFLEQQSVGESAFGYSLPAGSTQLDVLPWNNINQISVRFSEHVLRPGLDLSVAGINLAGYTVSGFVYDIPTYTATWTLSQPLRNDRLVLALGGGDAGVLNAAGLRLDGEWASGAEEESFPSGDGMPGGDFRFGFNVLPGDTDRSGSVLASDYSDVKKKFFSTTANPGDGFRAYSIFHDVNGSGSILADDFSEVKRRFFDTLPRGDPLVAPAASAWPATPARTRPATRELFSSARVLG
jgi:hypothetical protein